MPVPVVVADAAVVVAVVVAAAAGDRRFAYSEETLHCLLQLDLLDMDRVVAASDLRRHTGRQGACPAPADRELD
jgi:hypothetical protein